MSEEAQEKKRPSVKAIAAVAAAVIVIVAAVSYWFVTYQIPHNEAVAEFDEQVAGLAERNDELDKAIADLQAVMKSDEKPLDESLIDAASSTIGEAQGAKQDAPEMPGGTDEILAAADGVAKMGDYAEELGALAGAKTDLENSIAQLKQVTAPTEQFVIERVTGLPNVTGVEAVTEGNDPNGNLGKAGSYSALVYFSSDLVDSSEVYISEGYSGIVGAGCDGGGAVEVYQTTEDAEKRDQYLAAFDGSILASGSHKVVGACVVRTSTYLTASQQNAMEQAIVDSLTRL